MNDLISRQAAIEHFRCTDPAGTFAYCDRIIDFLESLPAIVHESEKDARCGKWIEDAKTYYETIHEKGGIVDENTPYFVDDIGCPECLAKFSVIDNETERFKFCPNCGAKMEDE